MVKTPPSSLRSLVDDCSMLWNTSQMQPSSMTRAAMPDRAVNRSGEDLTDGAANRLMVSAVLPVHRHAGLGLPRLGLCFPASAVLWID